MLVNKVKQAIQEIQEVYLKNNKPFVIGYSGGKDSTAVAQLVMYALAKLPKSQLTIPLHILSNDTLVENPTVAKYIDNQLALIENVGKQRLFAHDPDLFHVVKVTPAIGDRFWLNMIGRGYVSPNRWFRWCTERLKINPTSEYIKKVTATGDAIVVLGSRKAESKNRAKTIEKYDLEAITGTKLQKHQLPGAWAYKPIADWTTQEVWQYLMSVPSFWGGDNKKLVAMYRNASENADECPLVIDTTTASCGNSRFGCWVCTVVSRDKSMENLIENGEDWMLPLLEFRDYIAELRNESDARFAKSRAGTDKRGGFLFSVRADLLKRVLEIEEATGIEAIGKDELAAIQLEWEHEGCFDYSVDAIYYSVKKKSLNMVSSKGRDFDLLSEVCAENDVNPHHILELIAIEKNNPSHLKRTNIFKDLEKKLGRFITEI